MNKKRIIYVICLVLGLILLFLYFTNHTVRFNGVLVENEKESKVQISLKIRRLNYILIRMTNWSTNRISGNISVQTEDYDTVLKYDFIGPAYNLEDCRFAYAYRLFKSEHEDGPMFFDKEFKNIVFITNFRKIYAVDNKFRNIMKRRNKL